MFAGTFSYLFSTKSTIFVIFNIYFFPFLACFIIYCNTIQNNNSKNIYDGLSYVSSKNSSNESFIQPVIDQATNSVVKQFNHSANISSQLHISTLLNVPDRDVQNEVGNFNEG